MAKVLKGRTAPPDDPIFSGGIGIFSVHTFRPSSTSSAPPDPMQPAIDAYEKAMMDMATDKPGEGPKQPGTDAPEQGELQ